METYLVLSYAVFLASVAGILELVARHVHRRSERGATAGFTYVGRLDLWECPDGRQLHRAETDSALKVVRYRAEAHHCNGCVFKFRCTDSDSGRVIERYEGSWLNSGLYQFHRGMSLALIVLAAFILAAEMVRTRGVAGETLLTSAATGVGIIGMRLLKGLRSGA